MSGLLDLALSARVFSGRGVAWRLGGLCLVVLVGGLWLGVVSLFAAPAWGSVGACGPAVFGVCEFENTIVGSDEGSAPAVQAGSHPSSMTTTVVFNHLIEEEVEQTLDGKPIENPKLRGQVYGEPKTVRINLPAGVAMNLARTPAKCTELQFQTTPHELTGDGGCPLGSVIGVATAYAITNAAESFFSPVYNLMPPPGVPGALGLDFGGIGLVAHIMGSVRTGTDYGLSGTAAEVPQLIPLFGVKVTFWGDPGSPSHDAERGERCAGKNKPEKEIEEKVFENLTKRDIEKGFRPLPNEREYHFNCPLEPGERHSSPPLLTMPLACTGESLNTALSTYSWQEPATTIEPSPFASPAVTGCEDLSFHPSLSTKAEPAVVGAESPSGLNLALTMPQEESRSGLAESELKDAVVTLPLGVAVSPSAAGGLQACSPAEIGFKGVNPTTGTDEFTPELPRPLVPGANFCPDASKLGEVEVITPLLEKPLKGALYLAQQGTFENALVGLYIVAEGEGALIKLGGVATLDPSTGQITTSFKDNPQQPFSELRVKLFPGPRAPLVSPPTCGTYTTTSSLTPWSAPFTPAATPSSSEYLVRSGCGTGGFQPRFTAGTASNQAGGSSPFSMTLARQDGEQRLSGIQITTPPGLLGTLSTVTQCPEPQASSGECGPASEIGQTTVSVGPGEDPYWVKGGKVYLTGPYEGAPFGLSIVVPTTAGPFTLTGNGGPGREIVRARIEVDPYTAQIKVTSDPLPTILQGVPLDIRTINVTVNRPGFMVDPTDCSPLSVAGTLEAVTGTKVPVSAPFESANCASLPFKPTLTAFTAGKTSKVNGASLTVRIASAGIGQAGIAKVQLTIPSILPSRLTTIQKACTEAQFNSNPAGCPPASRIATATVHTPLLASPLSGPVYFVSHGGAAFPDTEIVLQGEGVTLVLDGHTQITKGVTYSRFEAIPDAPFTSFEFNAPEGPYSIFGANGNLCQTEVRMPTTLVGQNGAVINQSTLVQPEGCANKLTILSHRVHKRTLTLRTAVPAAGKLTAIGKHLSKASNASGGRGIVTLTLKAEGNNKLKTKVTLTFTPSKGKRLTAAVAAQFKR